MRNLFILTLLAFTACCQMPSSTTISYNGAVRTTRIWDDAPHSAFTSLLEYDGYLYCAFRQGTQHADDSGENGGTVRVIRSKNGNKWESVAHLVKPGYDLRDASLVVLPSGELALYMGVSHYKDGDLLDFRSHYSIMKDGQFTEPKLVLTDFDSDTRWLWKVRKQDNILYTFSYGGGEFRLLSSEDGLNFKTIKEFDFDPSPNEADIKFEGDEMIAIVRNWGDDDSRVGRAKAPYTEWKWTENEYGLGGPEINGDLMGSRIYLREGTKTVLYKMTSQDTIEPWITLPSGGDCSYPGIVRKGDKLLVSYYSSHELNTAIYFSVIDLKKLQ